MLAARAWSDMPLAELVASEIAPYGAERFVVEGPELLVAASAMRPGASSPRSMKIGANAASVYGSLAAPRR